MEGREFLVTAKDYTFSAVGSLIEASRQRAARREQAGLEKVAREAAHRALYARIGDVFDMNLILLDTKAKRRFCPFPMVMMVGWLLSPGKMTNRPLLTGYIG